MTESRGSYTPSSGDSAEYDEHGLDAFGYSAADKHAMMARFARRLAAERGTMAALLADYRRIEGISDTVLLQRLEISPEQCTRLSLCLVPRTEHFADDVRRLSEISGAKASQLANIVHEVSFLAAMPTRVPNTGENPALAGSGAQRIVQLRSAMAARDRLEQGGAVHEASSDYAASAPADASASEADAPVNPDNASPATDMPPVDSSHDE